MRERCCVLVTILGSPTLCVVGNQVLRLGRLWDPQ